MPLKAIDRCLADRRDPVGFRFEIVGLSERVVRFPDLEGHRLLRLFVKSTT